MSKRKLLEWYVCQRNYLQKGYGEVSWLKGLAEFFLIAGIFVKVVIPDGTGMYLVIAAVGICGIVFCWCWGWAWDTFKCFHIETEWANRRNPFVRKVLKRLKRKV